mgnify:CR=1 FL=1
MIGYFGLISYDLPENYLVPRVPQRLVYLDWIKGLFDLSVQAVEKGGFDIGVGANCIYPILAIVKYGWKMCGSEINDSSIKWASEQIIGKNQVL